jgi:hypothetical protein
MDIKEARQIQEPKEARFINLPQLDEPSLLWLLNLNSIQVSLLVGDILVIPWCPILDFLKAYFI